VIVLTILGVFLLALIVAGVSALISSVFLMIAWNFLVPVFNLPHLDFLHAFALTFLIALVGALLQTATKQKS
jgi:hypothetical protein